uniref:Disease resistance protein At4g27190-like leucine-rich repeats domain-containing protein n=1 Tax=Cannabis sativa TaxID=3483 RepID=A0A803QWR6_CANSA
MLMWKEWSFCTKDILGEGQTFPLLKELDLSGCPKLNVGLPCYLPSLEDLHIEDCEEMEVLLPRTTQQTLTAPPFLAFVFISNCPVLESLLDWGSHPKVENICLWNTRSLFENRSKWELQRLPCLKMVNIVGWEEKSFPEEGLLPITLDKIVIQNCSNLESLNGKAFQQLTSLTYLYINNCERLQCLPEEGLPNSLSDLVIWDCPLVKQRCEKGGEDWPKIQHIAKVELELTKQKGNCLLVW